MTDTPIGDGKDIIVSFLPASAPAMNVRRLILNVILYPPMSWIAIDADPTNAGFL
jgi:hypothetical protein